VYSYKESQARLNEQAISLSGDTVTFKVHYWGVSPKLTDNPIHKHSFFEVCYVMDGVGEYTDEGIDYPLSKGTHFCSRPGVTHQIRTKEGLFLLFVAFELNESKTQSATIDDFKDLASSQDIWVVGGEHCPTALLWKSLLIEEQGLGSLPNSAIPAVAHALLQSFLTLFGKNKKEPAAFRHGSNIIVKQAKLYIRDNLSRPLSLHNISSILSVSERHLSRLFAGGIGESFSQYVRSERIHQAAHLLMNSELSIKEIAEATGFSSVHYFSRLFMKEKGLPPGKYRKRR
jgi:AraC-like DNA-binding protein/mannose-6-phosphate isomerase-like protein (cupin superfamily)